LFATACCFITGREVRSELEWAIDHPKKPGTVFIGMSSVCEESHPEMNHGGKPWVGGGVEVEDR
jgi:hypothetical protein